MEDTPEKIGIPRAHPDFQLARLERFRKLLKDARRILSKELSENQKLMLKDLYDSIARSIRERA